MSIEKEIVYQEYVQRENEFLRAPYNPELEFYAVIKSGNLTKLKELNKISLVDKEGLGKLSENTLQSLKYHFVISTALIARYCIEGGLDVSTAYRLSDFYIQKTDAAKNKEEISKLHTIMCEDYTKRMHTLQKKKIGSIHIARCIDYIYDHLHTRITVEDLATQFQLNPSYLSRLFKKETGTSVSEYIQMRKIETAQNMLLYSDYNPAQIASTLAFPSQSYFTEVFKKRTGMTPTKYRSSYIRSTELSNK